MPLQPEVETRVKPFQQSAEDEEMKRLEEEEAELMRQLGSVNQVVNQMKKDMIHSVPKPPKVQPIRPNTSFHNQMPSAMNHP